MGKLQASVATTTAGLRESDASSADDGPPGGRRLRVHAFDHGGAQSPAEKPSLSRATAGIHPEQVWSAVAVEVGHASELPAGTRGGGKVGIACGPREALESGARPERLHEPHLDGSRAGVVPHDVADAIVVEITYPTNDPVGAGRYPQGAIEIDQLDHRPAVHEPNRNLVGLHVAPEDVGEAVLIEVADRVRFPRGSGRAVDNVLR